MYTIKKLSGNLIYASLIGLMTFGLTACGGGGGGGGPTTPGVSSVNPRNGATNVEKTTVVTANFRGSIDAATVDDTTFTLGDSSGNTVAGSVMFDAGMNVATFTPDMDLGVLKTYTGTISSGVTHSGTTPISQYNWSFTTAEGNWTAAAKVDIDTSVVVSDPHIARGGDGEAMAVWITSDGFIYGRKYTAGAWVGIDSIFNTTDFISNLRIAMDKDGNAMVLWSQDRPGNRKRLKAKYYNGTSWSATPMDVEAVSGVATDSQIAFDAAGNAIVVWKQDNDIYANRYSAGVWQGEQAIESGAGIANKPALAVFDNGDAMAVWAQDDGVFDVVYSNYYTFNTGWEANGKSVGNSATGSVPQVAIDNAGNAFVVWLQGTAPVNVWAAQYDGGTTNWGSLLEIETDVRPSTVPQIGADSQGNAIAVWREASDIPGPSIDRLRYSFYDGTSWGTPDYVDNGVADSFDPKLVMDPEGHAVVVWRQKTVDDVTTPDSAWGNRYRSGSGWVGPQLLETDETWPINALAIDNAIALDLAIDKNGNAAAVWVQSDDMEGIDSVWEARFE